MIQRLVSGASIGAAAPPNCAIACTSEFTARSPSTQLPKSETDEQPIGTSNLELVQSRTVERHACAQRAESRAGAARRQRTLDAARGALTLTGGWRLLGGQPPSPSDVIVTRNLRDVARGELKFPTLRVLSPEQCLEAFPCPP